MFFLAKRKFIFVRLSYPDCVCGACLILPNSVFLCSSANSSNYFTTHLQTQSDTNEQLWERWPCLKRGAGTPIRFVSDEKFSPLGPSPSAAARLAHLTVPGSCSLQKVLKVAQTCHCIILIKLNSSLLGEYKCFYLGQQDLLCWPKHTQKPFFCSFEIDEYNYSSSGCCLQCHI